jgi:hypothetical protein
MIHQFQSLLCKHSDGFHSSLELGNHAAYVKTGSGHFCASDSDLKTEEDCRKAATYLGLKFAATGNWPGEHKYCMYASGTETKMHTELNGAAQPTGEGIGMRVYFNEATPEASAVPKSNYVSLCTSAHVPTPCPGSIKSKPPV